MTSADIWRFRRIFQKIDVDKRGYIHESEFLAQCQMTKTDFAMQALRILKMDAKGSKMDLVDFIAAAYNYGSYSRKELLWRIFSLFHLTDRPNEMRANKVQALVEYVHGEALTSAMIDALRVRDLQAQSEYLLFEDFVKMNQQFPILLRPAFQFQIAIHHLIATPKYWRHQIDHRADLQKSHADYYQLLKEIAKEHYVNFPPPSLISNGSVVSGISSKSIPPSSTQASLGVFSIRSRPDVDDDDDGDGNEDDDSNTSIDDRHAGVALDKGKLVFKHEQQSERRSRQAVLRDCVTDGGESLVSLLPSSSKGVSRNMQQNDELISCLGTAKSEPPKSKLPGATTTTTTKKRKQPKKFENTYSNLINQKRKPPAVLPSS